MGLSYKHYYFSHPKRTQMIIWNLGCLSQGARHGMAKANGNVHIFTMALPPAGTLSFNACLIKTLGILRPLDLPLKNGGTVWYCANQEAKNGQNEPSYFVLHKPAFPGRPGILEAGPPASSATSAAPAIAVMDEYFFWRGSKQVV